MTKSNVTSQIHDTTEFPQSLGDVAGQSILVKDNPLQIGEATELGRQCAADHIISHRQHPQVDKLADFLNRNTNERSDASFSNKMSIHVRHLGF